MRKLGEKRVTRIQAAQVALLPQPQTRAEVSPVTDLEPGPQPLHLGPAPGKRSITSSTSEHTGKKTRLMPQSSPRQETMQWQSIIGSGLTVRDESPWGTFRKYYDCDLAGPVAVCVRSSGDRGIWAVRHVSALRNFCTHWGDFDPLVLDHIVACKAFPDEQELAAIMSQLVDGLLYLVANNFHHTSLDCSSVIVNLNGQVKIARIDCCVFRQRGRVDASDLVPVSKIMMELMQKYIKEDGAVGIDNLDRWRTCPAAIEFLCATTSAGSFEELKEQRLLTEISCCPGNLIGIAWFALISARTFYSYTPRPMKKD
ncbi:hypothetical protein N7481_008533 [Penicillium waksmanii]|uniref:uncharacterized protein n=1 Tax=Penicillium waksmanii TaxID=69791 RepID=UPI0025476A7D|nr:uncharacterized protein N7481_008533 [Penicillium waksmanii]KAJ5974826.1 hypothetical protein N7481_008533 [Penicillium waksmanii]